MNEFGFFILLFGLILFITGLFVKNTSYNDNGIKRKILLIIATILIILSPFVLFIL